MSEQLEREGGHRSPGPEAQRLPGNPAKRSVGRDDPDALTPPEGSRVEDEGGRGSVRRFCLEQVESHANLRESDVKYAEYHRGAETAYRIVLERLKIASQARFVPPKIPVVGVPVDDGREADAQLSELKAEKPQESRAEDAVDLRPPDEFDICQEARERLFERLTDGPVPNPAELARVIDILR